MFIEYRENGKREMVILFCSCECVCKIQFTAIIIIMKNIFLIVAEKFLVLAFEFEGALMHSARLCASLPPPSKSIEFASPVACASSLPNASICKICFNRVLNQFVKHNKQLQQSEFQFEFNSKSIE